MIYFILNVSSLFEKFIVALDIETVKGVMIS